MRSIFLVGLAILAAFPMSASRLCSFSVRTCSSTSLIRTAMRRSSVFIYLLPVFQDGLSPSVFSGGMPNLRLTFLERERHCSLL
jgi:hypothetical protein